MNVLVRRRYNVLACIQDALQSMRVQRTAAASRARAINVLGAFILVLSSGCVADYYVSGARTGTLPSSQWNVNGILFGARGGNRTTHWSLLHDYESLAYGDDTAEGGWKFKLLGPYLPALFGAIDMNGERGVVTPLYSQHAGNIDSVAVGPLAFPIFRLDTVDDYWHCDILGIIHFGTPGWMLGVGSLGLSFVREDIRPLYLEVTTQLIDKEPTPGDPAAPAQVRVAAGAPDIWDGL